MQPRTRHIPCKTRIVNYAKPKSSTLPLCSLSHTHSLSIFRFYDDALYHSNLLLGFPMLPPSIKCKTFARATIQTASDRETFFFLRTKFQTSQHTKVCAGVFVVCVNMFCVWYNKWLSVCSYICMGVSAGCGWKLGLNLHDSGSLASLCITHGELESLLLLLLSLSRKACFLTSCLNKIKSLSVAEMHIMADG